MPERVLVVENIDLYAEEACRELGKMGCEALPVLKPEVIEEARKKPKQYERIVLGAIQLALKEIGSFDIAVVNLHLRDESVSLLDQGDFLGNDVLECVTDEYPGASCIVFTAQLKGRATYFLERYDVADIVFKDVSSVKVNDLCDAVKRIIEHGHPVQKKIKGRTYVVKGINSQIYRFLHNKGVISRAFSGVKDCNLRLIKVLGGDLLDERVGEAACLMADLWHLEPGLPCYPLIGKLGKLEFERAFWKGHRDHIIHQLLTYLLGLYLYYGSGKIRKALTDAMSMSEDEFLLAWKIASLFHDLGYVFEAESEESETYKLVFDELNDLGQQCLHYYSEARGGSVIKAEDDAIRNEGMIFVPSVRQGQIRSLSKFGSEDLFQLLEPLAQKAGLGDSGSSLHGYWEYAMSNSTLDRRPPYIDHGIAGALVLLQQYHSFKYYVEQALTIVRKQPKLLSKRTTALIKRLANEIPQYQRAIEIASSAIALHNVNVTNWDEDDAFVSEQLTLKQYNLSLEKTPFAFLLALVDVLQSWDRPKYTMPEKADYATQAQDIAIQFMDGKIVVAYESDPLRGTDDSLFERTLHRMSQYMEEDDLVAVLKEHS